MSTAQLLLERLAMASTLLILISLKLSKVLK